MGTSRWWTSEVHRTRYHWYNQCNCYRGSRYRRNPNRGFWRKNQTRQYSRTIQPSYGLSQTRQYRRTIIQPSHGLSQRNSESRVPTNDISYKLWKSRAWISRSSKKLHKRSFIAMMILTMNLRSSPHSISSIISRVTAYAVITRLCKAYVIPSARWWDIVIKHG